MHCVRNVTEDLIWIGGNDRQSPRFESDHPVPRGMSYNSYLLLDEKTVLFDTVDRAVQHQFFENLEHALQGRRLDYVFVHHMEPDHAATLGDLLVRYPGTTIVCNGKSMNLLRQFHWSAPKGAMLVKEGDTLCTGRHTFTFYSAPMVHWPEVMVSYDAADHILFSADAFGTFGALNGVLFADEVDFDRDWLDEARRYYTNIVGKYGVQVQAVLKKAATLPIETIAPLHGPVWRKNLGWFIGKYDLWSRCEPEEKAVVVLYGSMYGNTASAANALAAKVAAKGVKVAVHDLSCIDNSEAVAECWRASTIVLAAPTYNGGIYLPAANLLEDLKALSLHDRTFALVENGSWAPMSAKLMAAKIGELKNCIVLDAKVTVRGRLTATQDAELEACAAAVAASM